MTDERYNLYCEFKDSYISAHCDIKSDQALKNAQEKWNRTKNNTDEVKNLILTWRAKAAAYLVCGHALQGQKTNRM